MPTASGRILLRGGAVLTPSGGATAMLVVDGEIAWVGDERGATAHEPAADVVVELRGRLVAPGFVDAHVHLAATGLALQSLDLRAATSLESALGMLAAHADGHRGPVLMAHGWDETTWPDRRCPTRDDVDAAVGDLPAYVARVDSHSAVVSTALLALRPELADSDGWSADGGVERDAHHAARDVTHGLRTEDDRRDAIRLALRNAAARGITSAHELNAPHISPVGDFALIGEIAAAEPTPEVVPYWGERLERLEQPRRDVQGLAGDLCVDGAIGSRTAALFAPYSDSAGSGHLYLDADQVRDHVIACTEAGLQAGFHVIGDRALAEVTSGLRAAADLLGVDALAAARHRLEHVEMPTDDDIKTLAELGVVVSVQPAFDSAWGGAGELYEQRLGVERAATMNPFGRMRRAGVTLAFGSDSPITPLDPWAGVRAAMLHHAPDERLTASEAFEAHTRGGHHARRDDAAGVLAVGQPATFAVWDAPTGLDDSGLPALRPDAPLPVCVQTVVKGATIHPRHSGEERP